MMTGMAAVAVGMIATILALFLAGIAYGHHRRQSLRFWHLEKRLPDAVRYQDLQVRVAALEAEHDAPRERLFDANDTLDEAARKQEWMETVREEIASLEQQWQEVERIQNELETKQVSLAELQEQLLKEEAACKEVQKTVEQLREDEQKLVKQLEELRGEKEKLEAIKREVADRQKEKARAEEEMENVKRKGEPSFAKTLSGSCVDRRSRKTPSWPNRSGLRIRRLRTRVQEAKNGRRRSSNRSWNCFSYRSPLPSCRRAGSEAEAGRRLRRAARRPEE